MTNDNSHKQIRSILWPTGIIAGLILVLYSPLFIWSPPWSKDGYYHPDMDTKSLFVCIYLNREKVIFHRYDNTTLEIDEFSMIESKGLWKGTRNINYLAVNHVEMKFINQRLHIKDWIVQGNVQPDPFTAFLDKISNPFTIWHIKWLDVDKQVNPYNPAIFSTMSIFVSNILYSRLEFLKSNTAITGTATANCVKYGS